MIDRNNDRGLALIGVVLVLAMLMGLAAALAKAVNSDTQLRGAFGRGVTGMYAAESGLNQGMAEFRNIFLSFNVPTSGDYAPRTFPLGNRSVTYSLTERPGNPQSITIPSGELFGGLNSLQYAYTVSSKAGISTDVEAEVGAEFNVNNIPLFQFVAFYIPDLEVLPGPEMRLHGRIHANEDLYLNVNDGNNLYIEDNPATGISTVQVSTAGNVYRGRKNDLSYCTGTVTIDMLQDTASPFGNLDPRVMGCSGGTRLVNEAELALWKGSIVSNIQSISVPEPDIINRGSGEFWERADLRIVLNTTVTQAFNGSANPYYAIEVQTVSGARDVSKTNSLIQFMRDNTFNANAANSRTTGTRPIFYNDVPVQTAQATAASITCTCPTNAINCNKTERRCYNPNFFSDNRVYASNLSLNATNNGNNDIRRGGFYNWREQAWILMLNVNIRDLILWNANNGQPFFNTNDNTDGGLVIFLSVQGPNSLGQNNYGVRVFGSNDIPLPGGIGVSADPTGVTVVSDQAIYSVGDYNRGPVVAGAPARQPAALIGDSVNVMSNNYFSNGCSNGCSCDIGGGTLRARNDCQSNLSLGDVSRDGVDTRINSAFLSGVDKTTKGVVSSYNGGLENYPRFHEDWGSTFTYNGSFVSLGQPVHVDGPWCGTGGSITGGAQSGCNIYNPPTRVWQYDPAFNQVANLPPLTPRFVYVQQVLFTESFK